MISVDIPREATLYMKEDGNIEIVLGQRTTTYTPPNNPAPGYTSYTQNTCNVPLLGGFQLQFGTEAATYTGTLIMYGCEGLMSVRFFNSQTGLMESVDQTIEELSQVTEDDGKGDVKKVEEVIGVSGISCKKGKSTS